MHFYLKCLAIDHGFSHLKSQGNKTHHKHPCQSYIIYTTHNSTPLTYLYTCTQNKQYPLIPANTGMCRHAHNQDTKLDACCRHFHTHSLILGCCCCLKQETESQRACIFCITTDSKVKPQVRLQEEALFQKSEMTIYSYSSHLKSTTSNHK